MECDVHISVAFLDILSLDKTYFQTIDMILSTVSLVGIISVSSFCADKLLLRLYTLKKVLYDIKTDRLFKTT